MKRIKKLVCLALSTVMVMSVLAGCGKAGTSSGTSSASTAKSSKQAIALVCSAAGANDNGYNESAINGLKKVKEEMGINYKVVESTDIPGSLETLAKAGYKLIFSLEYNFDALIKGVGGNKPIAEQYPDTTFVVFNDNPNVDSSGNVIHKNVISVMFNVNESSFLAGALSVLVNENADKLFNSSDYSFTKGDAGNKLGFIGGSKSNGITVFGYGFASGVNYEAQKLGKKYTIYTNYDAGFTDSAAGSTLANTFFSNGANVIYGCAGSVCDGIDAKAKEVKKLSIEVDANKDSNQPGYVLTSVIKNTEVPVVELSKYYNEGTLSEQGGKVLTYDLGSGATGITDLSTIASKVTDKETWNKILDELNDVKSKIGSGEIKVVNAQAGEKFEKSSLSNVVMPNE